MNKIASPHDLLSELNQLVTFIETQKKPSRLTIASKLRCLASRVATEEDKLLEEVVDVQLPREFIRKGKVQETNSGIEAWWLVDLNALENQYKKLGFKKVQIDWVERETSFKVQLFLDSRKLHTAAYDPDDSPPDALAKVVLPREFIQQGEVDMSSGKVWTAWWKVYLKMLVKHYKEEADLDVSVRWIDQKKAFKVFFAYD